MNKEMYFQKCGENDFRLFDDIEKPAKSFDFESFEMLFTYAKENRITVVIPKLET